MREKKVRRKKRKKEMSSCRAQLGVLVAFGLVYSINLFIIPYSQWTKNYDN